MLKVFESISPQLKFRRKAISIDNLAFKFHYRATFIMLLVCTLLVTSRQYIGEHIRCMTGGSPTIPEHVINTFCFFTTTFTVVSYLNETMLQQGQIPHPGIGPWNPASTHGAVADGVGNTGSSEEVRHHAYYQWVPFVLFLQALCFYAPHLFWRSLEKGRIKALVAGMQMIAISQYVRQGEDVTINKSYTLQTKITIDRKVGVIKREFLRIYENIKLNRHFATKLVACELLCLLNLLLQIYATHRFLGRQFLRLGIDFIRDDFQGKMDVLDIVFPKVTKCLFYKYGASGSIQHHDALCVMALNVINEKIYTFLWFWFGILLVVTVWALIWRLLTVCLHKKSLPFNGFVFGMACPGRLNPHDIWIISRQLKYSDWLLLVYLATNLDPSAFRNLFADIAAEIRNRTSTSCLSMEEEENSENETLEQGPDPGQLMRILTKPNKQE